MKLIKTIIDSRNRIVGFWIEGKESEFGGFDSQRDIQRPVQTDELIKNSFKNSQIAIINGRIMEQGRFKINELPMTKFENDTFTDIDSTMTLTKRIIHSGKLAGFAVNLAGTNEKYRYQDIIKLAGWFKPGNFVLRRINDKIYIAGKPGELKLEQLPEEVYGENVPSGKRRRVGTGGEEEELVIDKNIYNDKDLLTLYSIVREYDGVIIRMPNEAYRATLKTDKQVGSEFRDLGIAEIGNPYIQFGEKKLNANTTFKKVGNVMVPMPGEMPFPVYTYTWTTKSIFLNGENYIKRFAIAVSKEGVDKIKAEYEGALAIKPITDKDLIGPVMQLTGKKDLVFFEVDTSKISIISPNKAPSYILDNKTIKEIVETMMHLKLHNKFCNGMIKDLQSRAGADGIWLDDAKKPFGIYAGLEPKYLQAIKDAGIDIFSGAYTRLEDKVEGVEEESNISRAPILEVEYGVRGTDINKIKFEDMWLNNDIMKTHKMVDDGLRTLIQEVKAMTGLRETFSAVSNYKEGLEKKLNECRKKLWLHKISMYNAGKGKLHTHDRTAWIENVKSRAKATIYDCVEYGCEGLFVSVKGTTF